MRPFALVLVAAALAVPAAPASASCTDLYLRTCLEALVNLDKIRGLCYPPDAADPFGC
ncbi:MAG TPA: hypothetical protein VF519_12545 [Mycobacteriales bacterium]|jgi:hypothetical protein